MLRNQDLNLLPIFDALMREGQISRAAERLHMSQPAVSKALARLRLSLKDDLFIRTGRGIEPTPRARDLHAMFGAALALIREGYEDQVFCPQSYDRAVDLSMNLAAEQVWLPRFLRLMRRDAPKLVLQVFPDHLADIPGRLKGGRLSYAVEYLPMDPEHFDSLLLMMEPLTVICAAANPAVGADLSLAQFETLPQASLVPRSSLIPQDSARPRSPIEQLLDSTKLKRNLVCHAASFSALPELVAASDLLGVVPMRLAAPLVAQGRLRRFDLPFDCPDLEIRVFWHKSRAKDPAHPWLLERFEESVLEA